MKPRTYKLCQRCMTCVLLMSLFLQSCNHLSHSPIPLEAQEQGDNSQVLVKQDFLREEDKGCIVVPDGLAIAQEGLGEDKNEKFQENKIKTGSYMVLSLGDFTLFPRELLQETLSYISRTKRNR